MILTFVFSVYLTDTVGDDLSGEAAENDLRPARRVVVAEDETLIRLDIVEMLQDAGYEVVAEADNGQRATVDPRTGEVHGAGAGIGGGNPGEDLGEYSPSGDMYPLTGGEGTDHTPQDLGPAHMKE